MKRVIEMVVTPGTRLWSPHMSVQEALYLLSVAEIEKIQISASASSKDSTTRLFGVCILHASTAEFSIGQFADDERMTLLETLLVSVKPREVIYRPVRILFRMKLLFLFRFTCRRIRCLRRRFHY